MESLSEALCLLAQASNRATSARSAVIELIALPTKPGDPERIMAIRADAILALLPGSIEWQGEMPKPAAIDRIYGEKVVEISAPPDRTRRITTIFLLGQPPLATLEPLDEVLAKIREATK